MKEMFTYISMTPNMLRVTPNEFNKLSLGLTLHYVT